MESQNYGHRHPLLLLLNEDQRIVANCQVVERRCQLHVLAVPRIVGFTFTSPLYPVICNFCYEICKKFVYHCSCDFDLHIKRALFTLNMAENNLKELEHVALQDPLISNENGDYVAMCFGCWKPLVNYTHFSPDCGFNSHEKCAKLPLKLNFMYHPQHPLVLQFNNARLSCKICKATSRRGFAYGCTYCKLVFHIECLPPPLDLAAEDKHHQHAFTPLSRRVPYICDACGLEGIYVAYICSTCSIMVHKRCTTLPRIIKSKWHDHRLFHKYFLPDEFRSSDCPLCHDEANPDYGSYCCSHCNLTFHVNCVTEDVVSYSIVSVENEDVMPNENSISVIERNDAGEATKIKHFKHMHNLMLGPYENSCDGCMLPISDPFYYCSECDFFLHKACAELPRMKNVWHHYCKEPIALISNKAFQCELCWHISNAFAYECCECESKTCLRCATALTPGAQICLKHEHPLFFYRDRMGKCNACGNTTMWALSCRKCNFELHNTCFSLPITARHKCDEHLLSLTDHDDNNYPFLKLGSIYEEKDHPHPLTIVKKKHYYPDCNECSLPCEDVALECSKSECKYIAH
ncbi:hypothetical protein CXB51_006602 [Gossypium anomalum]|uniref:Phorbol-ester/DAG-type domain-containing protein n=1 Tax=Gossypium anomalum TaxID=47600 RepID=A0A8J5Z3A9_9ROSI|nr:hypothetical protein CXB51_006602 [Gossypium anomalum]